MLIDQPGQDPGDVSDEAYAAVASELNAGEIEALVGLIAAINAWNAVGASTRT